MTTIDSVHHIMLRGDLSEVLLLALQALAPKVLKFRILRAVAL